MNKKYVFEYNIYYNGGQFNAFHISLKTMLANFSINKFILRISTFILFNLMCVKSIKKLGKSLCLMGGSGLLSVGNYYNMLK